VESVSESRLRKAGKRSGEDAAQEPLRDVSGSDAVPPMKQVLSILIVVFGVIAVILAFIWLAVWSSKYSITAKPERRCCCCEESATP
jgi:hypothetical protein